MAGCAQPVGRDVETGVVSEDMIVVERSEDGLDTIVGKPSELTRQLRSLAAQDPTVRRVRLVVDRRQA